MALAISLYPWTPAAAACYRGCNGGGLVGPTYTGCGFGVWDAGGTRLVGCAYTGCGFGVWDWDGAGYCDQCLPPCDSPYFPTATPSEPPEETSKIHIILIGLTDDPVIGESVEADLKTMQELLENGIPQEQRHPTILIKGGQVTAKNILAQVDSLGVAPGEAILCYFAGHGGYDSDRAADDATGGRFFSTPQGALYQKTLYDHLRNNRARLVVLFAEISRARVPASVQPAPKGKIKEGENPVLHSLLFRYKGSADIDSSARELSGWGDRNGGVFTQAIRDAANPKLYPDPQFATWSQFLDKLADATDKRFLKLKAEVKKNKELRDRVDLEALKTQTEQKPQTSDVSVKY
jgi:hypothetical protein